jgi:hypothetical protein
MNLSSSRSNLISFVVRNTDSVIFSIISFVVLLLCFKHNSVGISPDSVEYISIARNFHDHLHLNDLSGQPVVNFPCLYPLLLGTVFILTGIDPLIAAPIINAFLFAGVVYLSGQLTYRCTNNRLCKWVVLVSVLLSGVLQQVYTMLWSETLFILLVLLFIQTYLNYKTKYTFKPLLILAIVAAMASVTRYAGITLIATGLLMILVDPKQDTRGKRNHFICFGFLASSLLILNLFRNYFLVQTFTGWREPGSTPIIENINYYGNIIYSWLMLPGSSYYLTLGTGILVLISSLTIFLRLAVFKKNQQAGFLVILAFFLVYSFFIIFLASVLRFEQIDDRLLAPLYVPLIITLVSLLYTIGRSKKSKILIYSFIITFALYINYNQFNDYADWYKLASEYGIPGFTDVYWQHSEIAMFLRSDKFRPSKDIPIYSNWNEAVYFFSGKNCKLIPHSLSVEQKRNFSNSKTFVLILFDHLSDNDKAELISLEDINRFKKTTKINQFSDGSIYVCGQ